MLCGAVGRTGIGNARLVGLVCRLRHFHLLLINLAVCQGIALHILSRLGSTRKIGLEWYDLWAKVSCCIRGWHKPHVVLCSATHGSSPLYEVVVLCPFAAYARASLQDTSSRAHASPCVGAACDVIRLPAGPVGQHRVCH